MYIYIIRSTYYSRRSPIILRDSIGFEKDGTARGCNPIYISYAAAYRLEIAFGSAASPLTFDRKAAATLGPRCFYLKSASKVTPLSGPLRHFALLPYETQYW